MKLYTADQMRRCDRLAVEAGVASVLLMEAAGRGVAELLRRHWPDAGRALVLCGPGNNGGDGYVAARWLRLHGLRVDLLEISSDPSGEDAARARRAWLAVAEDAPQPLAPTRLDHALDRSDVVVDALLGSGLGRPLEGDLAEVARRLSARGVPVLSVDVPTGISADSPVPPGPHVRATVTAQLAGPKLSSALEPARSAYGAWESLDIGIPPSILDANSDVRLLNGGHPPDAWSDGRVGRRAPDAHKYSAGTVLVIGGSPRYLGAAELACRGAHRAGAGLVTLAAEQRLGSAWPETVFAPLDWDRDPLAALRDVPAKAAGAIVAGPGLDPRARPHLPGLVAGAPGVAVLDAGALVDDDAMREAVRAHGSCLLTPHIGEAAALLDASTGDVLADPLDAARRIAAAWGAVVALKGATTVIARPDGRAAISTVGHPAMATGGTGDVLAGVAGALLAAGGAEGAELVADLAEAAVWLHGRAGEIAASRRGVGAVATDVAEALADALAS